MKGKIELYNISFLVLKVELHFNLDIVAATAWYGQEASRELSHGRARNSVLTWIYM